jgi:hypothetical protein
MALKALRGHWETRHKLSNNLCRVWLYWVRDVGFSEDRLHGRKVGPGLSMIRNLALNLIRALGYRFVVDGFRALSARADRGLGLLIGQQS